MRAWARCATTSRVSKLSLGCTVRAWARCATTSRVSVDTSGLLRAKTPPSATAPSAQHSAAPPASTPPAAAPAATPAAAPPAAAHDTLLKEIDARLRYRGPLTVADYMTTALTHPQHGYYMRRDVFGADGDFTTSPEISPLFGELVGVWLVACWQLLGQPRKVRLVEAGPGRGTLLADALRAAARFPAFAAAASLHLLEVSPQLRKVQAQSLAAHPAFEATWHDALEQVPNDAPTLLVAHELLDALPVHQFIRGVAGWREKLVDLRRGATTAVKPPPQPSDPGTAEPTPARNLELDERELDFVLAPAPTPASALFERECDARTPPHASEAEVCPAARDFVRRTSRRLAEGGGAALFVDYGTAEMPTAHTLRGISRHQFVHPLHAPGEVDLSADVDFGALRLTAARVAPELVCPPLSEQRYWLAAMGLEARVNALLKREADEARRREVVSGASRLVESPGMGSAYRVFALAHPDVGASVPGFSPG